MLSKFISNSHIKKEEQAIMVDAVSVQKKNENHLNLSRKSCPLLTTCGWTQSQDDQNTDSAR